MSMTYTELVEMVRATPRLNTRKVRSPIGEMLDGLLIAKGWTARDLEQATRDDEYPGYVAHQYIYLIMRGKRNPKRRMLNRLLKPFGYKAVEEMRLEPTNIEKLISDHKTASEIAGGETIEQARPS